MKNAAAASSVRDDKLWTCCTVVQITNMLPQYVDEARDILRLVNGVMRFRHGDRWKYTGAQFAQYLRGKNPHCLKASRPHGARPRGRKAKVK